MRTHPPARILIVDDDGALLRSLSRILTGTGAEVRTCSTLAEAADALAAFLPQLLLLDVCLPDGSGLDLLAALEHATPRPTVIAMSGQASPAQSFDLARLGAHSYLRKPLDRQTVLDAIDAARRAPPSLAPRLKEQVGHRALHDLEAEVRRTVVDEALARHEQNRTEAARELGISRQLLQHILRKR